MSLVKFTRITRRYFSGTHSTNFLLENLKNRAVIRVSGTESSTFLQGLITNDIRHLDHGGPGMFAMVLNKAGRILYDTLIYRSTPETFLVECDRDILPELRKHLLIFRVRKKISIDSLDSEMNVWVVFKANGPTGEIGMEKSPGEVIICQDPRLRDLGCRILASKSLDSGQICQSLGQCSVVEDTYRSHRYGLGVGEGIIDLPPTKCFPLEANCDYLHGLSVHKGCYLGQEFTARTYHTGVVRKRLMPVSTGGEIPDKPDVTVESDEGKNLGKLRGVAGKNALALLRIDPALSAKKILIRGKEVTTKKPSWWPQEVPKEKPSQ
ncbi:putative transferase CAF17 homolog, mitochondrial [Phlebotomus papatasi]|uniref:putative transferase CAF17 homolog, mitochondrial n=1 Tax=Phlebotomus papatasi TaxID=29031 RepID=UPI002484636B|nr:putative transferase CAF17 homolog, mitochondrial [Phlebotomus papatasi]